MSPSQARRLSVLFAAMRRALVIAGLLFAGLAAPASALEVEREVTFSLHAGGFQALLDTTDDDGDVTATLILSRGPQVAYYTTPAKVTADRVTARFGTLGALDFRYAPKRRGRIRCTGSEDGEAAFEGTFTFTGENEYVHLEADHAKGAFQVYPEPKSCPRARLARRVVPYHPTYSSDGATLNAKAVSRTQEVVREVIAYDQGGRGSHRIAIYAVLAEAREGMSVQRGVTVAARSDAFHWSLEKGTATLLPPAPFTGSAHFVRHGDNGHGTWIGSLGMPVLGSEPVEMAGSDFRAFIHKGVPQDE
jgi:hypothetical protein